MSAMNNFSTGGKVILLLLFVNHDNLSDNWPGRKDLFSMKSKVALMDITLSMIIK